MAEAEFVLPFATRTRYPGGSDPEDEDISRALVYANGIIEFVKSKTPF